MSIILSPDWIALSGTFLRRWNEILVLQTLLLDVLILSTMLLCQTHAGYPAIPSLLSEHLIRVCGGLDYISQSPLKSNLAM